MIVITGAAGFIGSCMCAHLNSKGIRNIMLVDDFSSTLKKQNYTDKKFLNVIERNEFIEWFDLQYDSVEYIIHLGARTDTTEFNYSIFKTHNVDYSKSIWQRCAQYNIPLIYASSAATYGNGEMGYDDNEKTIPLLKPLNPYGESKQEFDLWALQQENVPTNWYGLKFFNVYGPNEYHKARMASVIFHSFNQIKKDGFVNLFRSHRNDFENGKQLRDFIYVKDVVKVIDWLMNQSKAPNGIYNLGTGNARTFLDLVTITFQSLNLTPFVNWIDIPLDIRDKYQYFTEANMSKLKGVGYSDDFYSLEKGITDYVLNYLEGNKYF
jgi:ADP-L-glycero-D-manno-heptose 6-epimerase